MSPRAHATCSGVRAATPACARARALRRARRADPNVERGGEAEPAAWSISQCSGRVSMIDDRRVPGRARAAASGDARARRRRAGRGRAASGPAARRLASHAKPRHGSAPNARSSSQHARCPPAAAA